MWSGFGAAPVLAVGVETDRRRGGAATQWRAATRAPRDRFVKSRARLNLASASGSVKRAPYRAARSHYFPQDITFATLALRQRDPEAVVTTVDVVIPVYNEEHVLAKSIGTLHAFLTEHLPYDWRILVADNASTDGTLKVAHQLKEQYSRVDFVHLDQKGRGRALRKAWTESTADILSYMDVDLSTEIEAFPALIRAIAEEGYDLATGSRLARGARTMRSFKREFISRCYNLIIKTIMWTKFSDAQCGFKAISRRACDVLVPLVQNNEWFFDTELLILAEKKGYRIKDIPVRWIEDPDTRVKLAKTISEDMRGLWRLRTHPIP
jgi:glycosyltransferase involved in cell wall biosynthesis